jgi:hypothetical protein
MSRWIARGAVALTLMVGSPLAMSAASPTVTPFEGVFYPCSETAPTREWVSGNVLHFRNAQNHNLWATGEPLLDGFADNVVDADINLKTGTGVAHPRESLQPDAVDGTWEITVTVDVDPTGLTARGVGRGTGELRGMTLEFTNPGIVELAPGANPCSDIPVAVLIEGEIRAPA